MFVELEDVFVRLGGEDKEGEEGVGVVEESLGKLSGSGMSKSHSMLNGVLTSRYMHGRRWFRYRSRIGERKMMFMKDDISCDNNFTRIDREPCMFSDQGDNKEVHKIVLLNQIWFYMPLE